MEGFSAFLEKRCKGRCPCSQSYGFSSNHVQTWEGPYRRLSTEELMLWNCASGEDSFESPLTCKQIHPIHPKGNQSWVFTGRTDAKALILWPPDTKSWLIRKDPDAGERLKVGEGEGRGWDGWIASPTRWTWVWANSQRWWRAGKPEVLQSMVHKESDTTERLNNRGLVKKSVPENILTT